MMCLYAGHSGAKGCMPSHCSPSPLAPQPSPSPLLTPLPLLPFPNLTMRCPRSVVAPHTWHLPQARGQWEAMNVGLESHLPPARHLTHTVGTAWHSMAQQGAAQQSMTHNKNDRNAEQTMRSTALKAHYLHAPPTLRNQQRCNRVRCPQGVVLVPEI